MELGWTAVIQTGLLAIFTVIIKVLTKKDTDKAAEKVVQGTAAQTTSNEILARVSRLEMDVELVKRATVKECDLDHRGPKKE